MALKKIMVLMILLILSSLIMGCNDGDVMLIGNPTIIGGTVTASGSNNTLIVADECLDLSCNTFVEVNT